MFQNMGFFFFDSRKCDMSPQLCVDISIFRSRGIVSETWDSWLQLLGLGRHEVGVKLEQSEQFNWIQAVVLNGVHTLAVSAESADTGPDLSRWVLWD